MKKGEILIFMDTWINTYIKEVQNSKYKTIYIYGAGKIGKIILNLCCKNDVIVNGFVVTDSKLNPQKVSGIPVYQFDMLDYTNESTLFLIGILELGERKIAAMLEQQGVLHYLDIPKDIFQYDETERKKQLCPAMEITTRAGCAVNCKYCPQERFLRKYYQNVEAADMLSFLDFRKCLDKLPKQTGIYFSGFAEPFLNPESVAMMEYAHAQGYEMELYTTLVGLNLEGFQRIKDIPFRHVVVHTADAEGYANIAVTNEYLKLLAYAINYKRPDGSPFVAKANCQGTPHPEVLKIAEGIISIHCELTDRAGNLDIPSKTVLAAATHPKGRIRCIRADNLDHNVLLPDGRIVLCCNDFGMEHTLGNLLEDSYESIMNGDEMQKIQRMMIQEESDFLLCRKCVYAEEIV